MTGTGPQKYPGASTAYFYQNRYGGDVMEVNVCCLHTTEGTTLPDYDGGAVAPNLTAVPDFTNKRLKWYQHFDIDRSSRALRNLAGGVQTNTLNVTQVELEGTCDYSKRASWGSRVTGKDYIYWGDPPDWALRDLADFLRWLNANHNVPLTGPAMWLNYGPDSRRPGITPASYGASPARMTFAQLIALAKGGTIPEEDDMPTADEIAVAVVNKLIAGGGVLEGSDLQHIWTADVVPAARPPYNNPDYYGADGKTPNNVTWSAGYTQQTQTEGIRETLARVKGLEGSVGAVDLTDQQIASLASAVAANPALAEQIAEKVAVKLAERLAE